MTSFGLCTDASRSGAQQSRSEQKQLAVAFSSSFDIDSKKKKLKEENDDSPLFTEDRFSSDEDGTRRPNLFVRFVLIDQGNSLIAPSALDLRPRPRQHLIESSICFQRTTHLWYRYRISRKISDGASSRETRRLCPTHPHASTISSGSELLLKLRTPILSMFHGNVCNIETSERSWVSRLESTLAQEDGGGENQ